jgi:hypothetical protein
VAALGSALLCPGLGSDHVTMAEPCRHTNRSSDKLDFPLVGPFKILAKAENSYKLELPFI